MTDPDFILASIDTARSIYNIDTALVYLTGMSCNAFQLLQYGLDEIYPFKGIFPWVPYFSSFTSETFNLDSEIPVVVSVGSNDDNFDPILRLYDSLASHGSDVDLLLVQGIGHTLDFGSFSNEMIRCMHYLNDTNAISIDIIPTFTMFNTDLPAEIKVKIAHETAKEMNIRALSSNTFLAANPQVTTTEGNDTIVLKITPNGARRYGKFKIIVEASEVGGTAIEQRVFKVDMQNGPISAVEVNSDELVAIYPNPAENLVYINSLERNISIRIFDINGRSVYSADNIDNSLPIYLTGLTKGIYFLKAQGNNLNKTFKLIKE